MTPKNDAVPGRVPEYEWLRLIATVFVVVGHSAFWVINTTHGGVYYGADEFGWIAPAYFSAVFGGVRAMAGWVYRFHMAAFFFLSGAVLRLRPIGAPGRFLAKKARRLLVPYYLCGLVWMLPVKYLAAFYTAEELPAALGNFLLGGGDSGHLWFLPALFWCMAVFALLEKLLAIDAKKWWFCCVPLALGAALHLLSQQLPVWFALQQFAAYFIWFALGWAFEPLRAAAAARPCRGRVLLLAGGFALVSAGWIAADRYGLLGGRSSMLVGCIWCWLLAALCAKMFEKCSRSRLFAVVSRQLFCVYLLHDPLEHLLLRLFMENHLLAADAGCWAYLLARTVGVFAFCVAAGELHRLLQQRKKEKTQKKEITI